VEIRVYVAALCPARKASKGTIVANES
jgi:hypothetical protein